MAPLFSSSSGNCTYIGTEQTGILIDAGMPGRSIVEALESVGRSMKDIHAILVTHEHADHVKGVGVLSRKYDLPVYATEGTWCALSGKLGAIARKNIRVVEGDFYVGDLAVCPVPISHDAAAPTGYSLSAGRHKASLLTDTGRVTQEMISALAGSGLLLLESNHDVRMLKCGPYPAALKSRILSSRGHLSNEDAGKTAVELVRRGVRGILLGHLSKENNDEQLALSTVARILEEQGIRPGKDMALGMTRKQQVTGLYTLR